MPRRDGLPFWGTHLGAGLANKMPTVAALPPPHTDLRKHWEPWEVNQVYSVASPQPPARALGNGSAWAPTRRQVKRQEGWLLQMVQLFPKWQRSSPSHSERGTHFCIGTAGTQLTSGCLLQQKGGGEWVVPDPEVMVLGLLCRSALALPEHTPVAGRLGEAGGPQGSL